MGFGGRNDRGTLETTNDYGKLLRYVGKFWEAELILRAILGKGEDALEYDNPWTIETRNEYIITVLMSRREKDSF